MKDRICGNCGREMPCDIWDSDKRHPTDKTNKKDLVNCIYKMAEHISRQGCVHCPMERLGIRYCWGDCIDEITKHFLKIVKE